MEIPTVLKKSKSERVQKKRGKKVSFWYVPLKHEGFRILKMEQNPKAKKKQKKAKLSIVFNLVLGSKRPIFKITLPLMYVLYMYMCSYLLYHNLNV